MGSNFGSSVLVAGNKIDALQNEMELRAVAFVDHVPERRPIEVYELVNVNKNADDGRAMYRDAFHKGIACFHEGDFASALENFEKAIPSSGIDRILEYYRNLAEEKIERGNE